MGEFALTANTTASDNTAIGCLALFVNTEGAQNTAIGEETLVNNTSGSHNTAIGSLAGSGVTTASDVLCIRAANANVDSSCYIGNIWQQPGGSQAAYVNSDGKLGAQVSSRRFKDEIKPMEQASEVIYQLNPVSFRYKAQIEPSRPTSFGLIAEEVEEVNPDLVARDKDGNAFSVRYDQVNAMLLNEFLKEHRKNEEQEAAIARQQKQIDVLTAGLQKVSAELELSKRAPQLAVSHGD
jgi:Chaperone of endosialidase